MSLRALLQPQQKARKRQNHSSSVQPLRGHYQAGMAVLPTQRASRIGVSACLLYFSCGRIDVSVKENTVGQPLAIILALRQHAHCVVTPQCLAGTRASSLHHKLLPALLHSGAEGGPLSASQGGRRCGWTCELSPACELLLAWICVGIRCCSLH